MLPGSPARRQQYNGFTVVNASLSRGGAARTRGGAYVGGAEQSENGPKRAVQAPASEARASGRVDHHRPTVSLTPIIARRGSSHKDFWSLDLKTGHERQLTNVGRGYTIGDFDISPDGRETVFDRVREQSNIILFDLPAR